MQASGRQELGADPCGGGRPPPLPQTYADFERLKGRDVQSADGARLGNVIHIYHPLRYRPAATNHHYLLVARGRWPLWCVDHHLYVPEAALRAITPERIVLAVRRDQIQGLGWAHAPPDIAWFHRS